MSLKHNEYNSPRLLRQEYLPLYIEEQSKRHIVKTGITGWARVNGRNSIFWIQKFDDDLRYVEHLTFWLDLNILFVKIKKVFVPIDVNSSNYNTSEYFNGKF